MKEVFHEIGKGKETVRVPKELDEIFLPMYNWENPLSNSMNDVSFVIPHDQENKEGVK